ncbi:hypothetical protein Cs7R123_54300 [Catellatospora sp. TT07R-123]|uniref:hypothetical protein n=1 Tax=Catellatospora sp. TT07R-123 TaxID=2733863 RepID=UPI001B24077E|nr:hypothetical protein [Catellatospora sp. TT07R-123]GHJ48088.1 hypothetical protein Cs7R123_54300 [Catellatospora sp. TT07R-123]
MPRTVRIHYRRGGSGRAPWRAGPLAAYLGAGGAALALLVVNLTEPGALQSTGTVLLALVALLGLGAAAGVAALYAAQRTVVGQVVHRRIWNGDDGGPDRYWIAVDHDGRSTKISGYRVDRGQFRSVMEGAQVRLKVAPVVRYVAKVRPLRLPEPVNAFPGGHAAQFPHGLADLAVSPEHAAAVLDCPVEPFAFAVEHTGGRMAGVRAYGYVPLGTTASGDRHPHAVLVYEAPDAVAADRLGHLVKYLVVEPWLVNGRGDGALCVRVDYHSLPTDHLAREVIKQVRRGASRR